MPKARFVHTSRAFALSLILAVIACGTSPATDTSSEQLPTETVFGAELPSERAEPAGPAGPATGAAPPGMQPQATPPSNPSSPSTPSTPDDGPASEPPSAPGPSPAAKMPYRGINLAGAEFGTAIPGSEGKDYNFPTNSQVDYYLSKGMNTFRIGFMWERLQRAAYGAFDETYASKLYAVVTYATSKGATVILNPHNFARYYGNTVGSSQVPSAVFADFWGRLSKPWASNPRVMFNLVNEPHDMPTEQWVNAANAAIVAIRATGSKSAIVVPGNSWTGAHSWAKDFYGTPNSVALLKIVDSGKNVIFEAHQYMDTDSGGGSDQCVSTKIGSERLVPFVSWLRANKLKGMIGEFAGGRNQNCNVAVTDMLTTMMASSDVLVGWLWWAGGPGWGEYKFTLEPSGGKDRPQMAVLAPFLKQ